MSPMKDPNARRRYHREWIAQRRSEFFADRRCVDCGSNERLELDCRDTATKVSHRIWSWSDARREAELAKYEVRCALCRRKRLAAEQTRHGTRGRYEKGCRCDACKAAKAHRNKEYRSNHRDELLAKQRAGPQKPRAAPNRVRDHRRLLRAKHLAIQAVARPDRRRPARHSPGDVRHQGGGRSRTPVRRAKAQVELMDA